MALFKMNGNKLNKLSIKSFQREKDLQKLCESNLDELFQVRFVATEFPFGDEYSGRLDTIGIDYEGNPVIIEYKLDKNSAVLSQCLFYMDWLVNHKGDFEVAVKEKLGKEIKITWGNPKMILVAQDYNKYDKYAVNQINYDIYLYKYTFYTTGELYLENINVQENKKYFIPKNEQKENESNKYERKIYSIEHHLENCNEKVKELYHELNEKIIEISDQIEVRYSKYYISYRTTKNFAEIYFKKNFLQVYVTKSENYNDPANKLEKVPESYRWSLGNRMDINNSSDIDYIINIIIQSYESTL